MRRPPIGAPAKEPRHFRQAAGSILCRRAPSSSAHRRPLRPSATVARPVLSPLPRRNPLTHSHGFNRTLRARRKAVCSICRAPPHDRLPIRHRDQRLEVLLRERHQYVLNHSWTLGFSCSGRGRSFDPPSFFFSLAPSTTTTQTQWSTQTLHAKHSFRNEGAMT